MKQFKVPTSNDFKNNSVFVVDFNLKHSCVSIEVVGAQRYWNGNILFSIDQGLAYTRFYFVYSNIIRVEIITLDLILCEASTTNKTIVVVAQDAPRGGGSSWSEDA